MSVTKRMAKLMVNNSSKKGLISTLRSKDGKLLYPMKNGPRGYRNLFGGQVIYNKFIENGVKDVFLYTGGAIMPLIDAFHKDSRIKYYINTHEQCAGHAATAYAKSTGRVGVSIVTSGPGLTNSITALTDATNDSTPFILFSGNVQVSAIGTNAFQECPAIELTQPVTKWSYRVRSVNELPDVVDEAFRFAQNGKPGAIHIDLPKCVTAGLYENNGTRFRFDHEYSIGDQMSDKEISTISKIIYKAKHPVILAGQGCNDYSRELRKFSHKANIPVTTTIHGMGVIDETNPLALDFLGMHGSVTANYAIQNADLIIALGTRFDDRITGALEKFAPSAFKAFKESGGETGGIIHVNKNKEEIGNVIKSHHNFKMDCGDFLNNIETKVINLRKSWFDIIREWQRKYPFGGDSDSCVSGSSREIGVEGEIGVSDMKTQDVMKAFNKYFIENKMTDHIVTSGIGNHQMMAAQYIKWRSARSFITSGSLGVMGTGLPYAIGCQIAHPDKMVIDIDGDGSFNQTSSELKTLATYNLPIKIAIMNDECFSMVRAWEKIFYGENYVATDLIKNPDYVGLAEAYDIRGIMCDKIEDLDTCIHEFIRHEGPILCDFRVKSDLCLPFVPPGAGLHEMIKSNEYIDSFVSSKSALSLPPS